MAGSVYEFVADWHSPYPSAPVIDPTGPASGDVAVARGGGSFAQGGSTFFRAGNRIAVLDQQGALPNPEHWGIRCCRTP